MQHVPVDTDKQARIGELAEAWLNICIAMRTNAVPGPEREDRDLEARRLYSEAMSLGASDWTFRERVFNLAVLEIARLREAAEDIVQLHAHHLEECTLTSDEVNEMEMDTELIEQRHHAATCALAHAVYILRNDRQERERIYREATENMPF